VRGDCRREKNKIFFRVFRRRTTLFIDMGGESKVQPSSWQNEPWPYSFLFGIITLNPFEGGVFTALRGEGAVAFVLLK